ncbi:unnamed protein product [Prorocentrum cordatum]|uniref:DNA mismatch repair proteins mutS family domain-containing protein n=1 Tax=Prorocentrum cordatum TaxID=2364126 RepID=A0ABN9S3H0_9DINO|nr:unnamed protein product [Polarella glacialis]
MTEDPDGLMAQSAEEMRQLYSMVQEMAQLEDKDLTLENDLDIESQIELCSRGSVLERSELVPVSVTIEALLVLRNNLERASARGVQVPQLMALVEQIDLPDELLDNLLHAFDEEGKLSEKKFPELAQMRKRVTELEKQSAQAMQEILASRKYKSYLSEDGYQQFGTRYVLSVKRGFADQVGETLDESRSGNMLYVEPRELAGVSDELSNTKKELKFKQRRILSFMCVTISRASEQLRSCIDVAARVDLARARLFLGEDLGGEVPEGLVLSGPNAGGKTVVLKTMALLALLARCGIPVPAGESPRVDFFDIVLADVGDMQTIVDDLSTYSAHLVAARIILQATARNGPRSLVLIDEAGTGTDPAQGAALARALLESLLDAGARLVATTHCDQLKNWALEDTRTEIAAMEYKEGQPTFRLTRNAIGESHAISVARRLELPASMVDRAESLLAEDQRSLLALQREVERMEKELKERLLAVEEREDEVEEAIRLAEMREAEANAHLSELQTREAGMAIKQEMLESKLMREHSERVAAHEQKLQQLLASLAESGTADSRLKIVGDAVMDLKVESSGLKQLASSQQKKAAQRLPGALGAGDKLRVGDWVVVLSRCTWYGFKGQVSRLDGGANGTPQRVVLVMSGSSNVVEVLKTEVGRTTAPVVKAAPGQRMRKKVAVNHRNYGF